MAERVGFEPTVEFPLHTLSKRAPSTTRTSLRLESTICGLSESDYRKTPLRILAFRDAVCIQRFANAATRRWVTACTREVRASTRQNPRRRLRPVAPIPGYLLA